MKLIDLKVAEFINEVDSKSPAPGGGSVSALAGSIAASLSRMVGHLTTGKKKFKALDESIQIEFNQALQSLLDVKEELTVLVDKDTEAFNLIMAAFKLPKETTEDKKYRSLQIEEATKVAIEVPYQVATTCQKGIKALPIIREYGNKNCLSDLGVSALMFKTGCIGALMNVKINLPGISDEELKTYYTTNVDEIHQQINEYADYIINSVYTSL